MDVKITKFGAQNFSCFTEPIEVELRDPTIHFIVGPNGTGKTSLLDIIPFTFYGKTSKGVSGPNLINNKNKKNCLTWVEFQLNNDNYRVERFYKYKSSDGANVYKNGEIIVSGLKDVTTYISSLITPYHIFTNTIFFSPRSTLFSSLTDTERKDILFKLIGIDEYNQFYEKVFTTVKELEDQCNEIRLKIDVHTKVLRYKSKELFEARKKEREEERKRTSRINELNRIFEDSNYEDILDTLEQKKQLCESEINDLRTYLSEIELKLKMFEEEKLNEKRSIENRFQEKVNELNAAFHQKWVEAVEDRQKAEQSIQLQIDELSDLLNKANNNITQLSTFKSTKELEINNLKDQINESNRICPTCKQEIKDFDDFKKHVEEKINQLEQEITKIDKQLDIILDKKEKIENKIQELRNNLNKIRQEVSKIKKTFEDKKKSYLQALTSSRIQLLNEIENKTPDFDNSDLVQYRQQIKLKEEELNHINQQIQFYTQKIKELNKLRAEYDLLIHQTIERKSKNIKEEIKQLFKERREYRKQYSELESKLKIRMFWKDAFSPKGIPSFLLDESIPFINSRLKYYLSFIDGNRYTISLDSQKATKSGEFRNKISINVLDSETLSDSIDKFSSGQRRIVDILLILALSDLQSFLNDCHFNFIMFDELFDTLDPTNIEYVKHILYELKKIKNLFIISHTHVDFEDAILYEF